MKVVSFFAGAGGLDLGFQRAGFKVVWANEYDKDIWETYEHNHPYTQLDRRSITNISEDEVPECDGIIGGPPCQSWSAAGSLRGIDDKRGQLFYDFIRILHARQPQFFLAENVGGMLAPRHQDAFAKIKHLFAEAGYSLSYKLINAADYDVPQDRKSQFPENNSPRVPLSNAIQDLEYNVVPAMEGNRTNGKGCIVPNHEYMTGGFSSIYMSRNRVRSWDKQSFTIQAGGRHAPLHPQAPMMELVEKDKRIFVSGKEQLYRRLSVRECARIQTFPDDFVFKYDLLAKGYKMIGNAVPVKLAEFLASSIKKQLSERSKQ